MIVDVYVCPICQAFVDKIYRINVLSVQSAQADPASAFQAVYACSNCFKPAAGAVGAGTSVPQMSGVGGVGGMIQKPERSFNLDLIPPNVQAQVQQAESAALIEAAKEQIHNKAVRLGVDADAAYKKAYRIDLAKDTDIGRLDRYNEKLARQIAALATSKRAGQATQPAPGEDQ